MFFLSFISFAALTAFQVAEKAYNINDGNTTKAEIIMKIINSNGSVKERNLEFLRKDYGSGSRILFKFLKPALVKGTALLTWNNRDKDNDHWIYLPALKRVRRIAASDKSKGFMGSDFSYEDLSKRSLKKDAFKMLKGVSLEGALCYVLEALPKDKSEKIQRRKVWIRKDNFLPIKAEYYDSNGNLIKELTTERVSKIQNIWTISYSRMSNFEKDSVTTMELKEIKYNLKLSDRNFKTKGMK